MLCLQPFYRLSNILRRRLLSSCYNPAHAQICRQLSRLWPQFCTGKDWTLTPSDCYQGLQFEFLCTICYQELHSYFYAEKALTPSGCYQKLHFESLHMRHQYQRLLSEIAVLSLFRQNVHNIWLLRGIRIQIQALQEREAKEEAMKHQQSQQQSREAHLAAMAEAHKGNISDRNQALHSAANDTGMEALPEGPLDQAVVNK